MFRRSVNPLVAKTRHVRAKPCQDNVHAQYLRDSGGGLPYGVLVYLLEGLGLLDGALFSYGTLLERSPQCVALILLNGVFALPLIRCSQHYPIN